VNESKKAEQKKKTKNSNFLSEIWSQADDAQINLKIFVCRGQQQMPKQKIPKNYLTRHI
jgi:hypothetical protein